jgi:hypothetical protein
MKNWTKNELEKIQELEIDLASSLFGHDPRVPEEDALAKKIIEEFLVEFPILIEYRGSKFYFENF